MIISYYTIRCQINIIVEFLVRPHSKIILFGFDIIRGLLFDLIELIRLNCSTGITRYSLSIAKPPTLDGEWNTAKLVSFGKRNHLLTNALITRSITFIDASVV